MINSERKNFKNYEASLPHYVCMAAGDFLLHNTFLLSLNEYKPKKKKHIFFFNPSILKSLWTNLGLAVAVS